MISWKFVSIFGAFLVYSVTGAHTAIAEERCAASYVIDVTVELSSQITQNESRILVELRQGSPGTSKVFDKQYIEGRTGTVSFSNMCAESYFITIGNGEIVAVGPVRQFGKSESRHTRVRVTQSSGNIGTRSRSGL